MRIIAVSLILSMLASLGCGGAYRVTYRNPSVVGQKYEYEETSHAHGIGPLLIGGGGFFIFLNPMSPALADWTGPVETEPICPNGFSEVSHGHNFGQSFLAGLISWIAIVNWYHSSTVKWKCLREPAS
jgi:hypothetical protein